MRKNGTPFVVKDTSGIHVNIHLNGTKVECTKHLEKDKNCNVVCVSFTVHKSGVYTIVAMVSGKHILGSPFSKEFEAGLSFRITHTM